jgi:hypothetical protein
MLAHIDFTTPVASVTPQRLGPHLATLGIELERASEKLISFGSLADERVIAAVHEIRTAPLLNVLQMLGKIDGDCKLDIEIWKMFIGSITSLDQALINLPGFNVQRVAHPYNFWLAALTVEFSASNTSSEVITPPHVPIASARYSPPAPHNTHPKP